MSIYGNLTQRDEDKEKKKTGNLFTRIQAPSRELIEPTKPSRLAQIKQRLEPVGKFLMEKRAQLGEEIGRLAPIRPAYAPAPEGEPRAIEELKESYKNSLVGKFDDRFRTFEKGFITARTGGIIKPEYQSEDNLTNKVIAGVAQVAGASASLKSIGSIFDGVTKNAIPIKTLLERFPKVAKYAYPLVKNAIVFDVYGQLDPDLQDRFKTLAKDTLMSIPFTGLGFVEKAKYSIPASFGLGFGLAKLSGAEDEDAFISGSIVAAFDAFGRLKAKDREFVSGRAADKIMKSEAIETLNRFSDVKLSGSPSEAQVNAAWKSASKKTHPDVGGTDANQRAVNTAKDYLLGKDIMLAKAEPTGKEPPAKARKPGEIPEGLPPVIKQEVVKPTGREVIKLETGITGVKSASAVIRPDKTAGISLEVEKEAQGKGVGTEAAKELERQLIEKDVTKVDIDAFVEARGFWEKRGYKVVEGAKEDLGMIKMEKDLVSKKVEKKPEGPRGEFTELFKEVENITNKSYTKEGAERLKEIRELLPEDQKSQVDVVTKHYKPAPPIEKKPIEKAKDKEEEFKNIGKIVNSNNAEALAKMPEIVVLSEDEFINAGVNQYKTTESFKKVPDGDKQFAINVRKDDLAQSYTAMKKIEKAPAVEQKPMEISKELEPLAAEARKYKSAEEFAGYFWDSNWVGKFQKSGFPGASAAPGRGLGMALQNFYNQATKGVEEAVIVKTVTGAKELIKKYQEGYTWSAAGKTTTIWKGNTKVGEIAHDVWLTAEKELGAEVPVEKLTRQNINEEIFQTILKEKRAGAAEMLKLNKLGKEFFSGKISFGELSEKWTKITGESPPKLVEAPAVEKEPTEKEFGLKSLHLKEGKVQRLAAAGIKTNSELRKMSADEVADLWTKSVSDPDIKKKLLEASAKIMVGGKEMVAKEIKPPAGLEITPEQIKTAYETAGLEVEKIQKARLGDGYFVYHRFAAPAFEKGRRAEEPSMRKDFVDTKLSLDIHIKEALARAGKKPPAPPKPPVKPKAPPKKKPTGKVKTMKPSAIKRAMGKPQIITLEYVRVKDGLMTFNNLQVEVALPTDLKDGLYEIVGDDFIPTDVPLSDFPPPVNVGKMVAKVDFETIADILTKHNRVTHKDETRPILTASLFDFRKDKLRVVSVDGFRMLVTDHPKVKVEKPLKIIGPTTKDIYKFRNVLGGGKVEIGRFDGKNENFWMSFDSEYARLTGRRITGEFPKFEKIYPSFAKRYTFDTKAFKAAIKTIKPYARERSNIMTLVVNEDQGTITAKAARPTEKGEKIIEKKVELKMSIEKIKTPRGAALEGMLIMPVRLTEKPELEGVDGRVGINLGYVEDALAVLKGDKIHFHTADPFPPSPDKKKEAKAELGKGHVPDYPIFGVSPMLFTDKIIEIPKAPGGDALAVGEFSNIKSARKHLNFYKVIEFPELVRLTKQLTGDYPRINRRLRSALGRAVLKLGQGAKVDLHPDIFKDNEVVGKVLAHELGHIADYFPEMAKARGNLIGRVASLTRYMKRKYGSLDDAVLRDELKALTQAWAPFDETLNPNFTKYRYSSKELYADAISVLFNDPALLKERAPEFWKGFFEYLDEKPKVKEEVFAIWDLLNKGQDAVLSERQKSIREMFDKGEDAFMVAVEEKRMADKDILFKLKYELVDRNQLVIDKVEALKKKGIQVSDELNPVYWLEGHNYVGGVSKVFIEENIQPIYRELKAVGLTWEDLGEVLFLDRVIHERGAVQNPWEVILQKTDEIGRQYHLEPFNEMVEEQEGAPMQSFSAAKQHKLLKKYASKEEYKNMMAKLPKGIANPLGFGRDTAQPQREFLKKQLGSGKWVALDKQLTAFRKAIKSIVLEAEDEGFYNPDLIKEMKANPAYATFQVLDYLDINIPASIKHQVGTLKEISNPASATVVKTISTIRAIERNKVKKKIIGFVKQYYPKEIESAKTIWTGKTHKPIEPRGRDRKTKALFTAMINGKYKGFYVDPYIAKTMEYMGTGQANAVVQTIRFFNSKLFRPMFITFNLGFQSFNLMRDFLRFYKNTPQLSLVRAVRRYKQATRPAFRRAWDIPDETISEMQKEKMLGITYNDVIAGMTSVDKQIDFAIAKAGLSPLTATKRRFFVKPFIPIFEVIERTGNFIESLPKVAGYKELNGKMPKQELASFIRTSVGSPDFLRKGAGYGWYNEVFLFSNAIKEGVRADYNVAFKNPKTRSGYWWKTAWTTFLPKLLMFGALMGLFGKKLKDMMEDVSEYDKTNYTILPMGRKNKLTSYLRIPQDETGRLIGGIFWKVLRFANNDKPILKDVTDLLSYTGGQIPSVSPIIDLITSTAQFMSGKNPYDYFRGRNVIPDDQFEAGGKYALKPFLTWQLNQIGAGVFFKTYTSTQPVEGKGWVQKVIEAPLLSNILGRWIKISNYGQREKNAAIVAGERQVAAKRRIEERELVNDAVKEYRAGTQNMSQRKRIEKQLVKDVVGDPPYKDTRKAKKTNTIKKFHLALIKGESDENINALIYAQSNDEKLALLVKIREDMETADFEALLKRLKQEKIVSSGVVKDLRKIK